MPIPNLKEILSKLKPKEVLGSLKPQGIVGRLKGIKLNRKTILIVVAILVVGAVLVKTTANIQKALFKKKEKPAKEAVVSFEDDSIPIKAYKLKKTDFKDTLPCMGNVKGFKEIDLKFQVAGVVESFNFEDGEKIQEGDIITSLIQKDALLKLKYAEVELQKNQKMFDLGAINKLKMDQSKLEYESAKSDLDKTNIYAMSNGLLGLKVVDTGSYVTPNDKVGTFVDITKVFGEFSVIEKDAPKVALGQKAEVFVDAYPNKSFAGVIDRIAPVVEGRSRTQKIKIELDNKEGILKPGMFARALVSTYEKKEALVIPASALKKKEADYFVYLVNKEEPKKDAEEAKPAEKPKKFLGIFPIKEKKTPAPKKEEPEKPEAAKEKEAEYGTLEIRKIKLGYMTQDLVEIAEGLKEDDLIVIEVQEEFKEKARVEISEVQEGLF